MSYGPLRRNPPPPDDPPALPRYKGPQPWPQEGQLWQNDDNPAERAEVTEVLPGGTHARVRYPGEFTTHLIVRTTLQREYTCIRH